MAGTSSATSNQHLTTDRNTFRGDREEEKDREEACIPCSHNDNSALSIDVILDALEDKVSSWSLAQDNQLATALVHISSRLRRRAGEVAISISSLERRAARMDIAVSSTANELLLRSDSQFVESRVRDYDGEFLSACPTSAGNNPKENTAGKPQNTEEDALKREELEKRAIQDGMRALPIFLDPADRQRRRRGISDVGDTKNVGHFGPEDTVDCCYYYDAAEGDAFNNRPLPYVVGSPEFLASKDAGLGDESGDEESLRDGHF
mmetsp:Transcript_49423/g.73513  ORF Transcript_49423/g.73513 Transcript_49423/m.73513 type:complete len:263 (-) Transcript_49423:127-915(-)|eukprot:CAMPEP_0195520926 /NCGR_PEP_ID=MMETSP0794_2-20130614/17624_1 /TAXON_ID=515487 /ORGANISM="Stephanopyxis turris, Strain CCMP 815" /LENGTH=262 /DNA_ID=CAMNT_0040650369 /DNA_START=212 /DNA_END=1000 /DNA_ORIENTATION=+